VVTDFGTQFGIFLSVSTNDAINDLYYQAREKKSRFTSLEQALLSSIAVCLPAAVRSILTCWPSFQPVPVASAGPVIHTVINSSFNEHACVNVKYFKMVRTGMLLTRLASRNT